jgi:hypothetical protein
VTEPSTRLKAHVPPPDLRAVRAAAIIFKGWPAGGFYTTLRLAAPGPG